MNTHSRTALITGASRGLGLALARALAPQPQLLLADEPTGNLDKATGSAVVDLLFRLQKRDGATLILVTHDEALAAQCDDVVRMGLSWL